MFSHYLIEIFGGCTRFGSLEGGNELLTGLLQVGSLCSVSTSVISGARISTFDLLTETISLKVSPLKVVTDMYKYIVEVG